MRNLFIRADASTAIGYGHIMRCMALAQAWQERGGHVTFLSNCQNKAMRQWIIKEGFEFAYVERSHPEPSDLKQVVERLRSVKNNSDIPWFVLDGYHFDRDYQKSIREAGNRLVVIDDYNHLPAYHADILINQNIGAEQIPYGCDLKTVKLFGPQYALLRTEFLTFKNSIQKQPEDRHRIMVTLGGADPDNITLMVLKSLRLMHLQDFVADVIVGPANRNIKKLEHEIRRVPKAHADSIQLLHGANMPEIMAKSDVAITAGGSTCWELCFSGIPSVIIIAAENQRNTAVGLERKGVATCLGWHEDIDTFLLSSALNNFLSDSRRLRSMSLRAKKIVDGKGRNRLINLMDWMEAARNIDDFSLRKVKIEDAFPLLMLANDRDVRRNSFNTAPISFENHIEWLNEKLASDNSVAYVLEVSGVAIAQVRYDKKNGAAEIDYAVSPAFRGHNIGCKMLEMTWKRACDELGVQRVKGVVKKDNKHSIFCFQKSGFLQLGHIEHSGCDCIVFERKMN
jgi:UDP-2,4-diacetamido-2,4,6-trideoxy-beta-L-altropyranose hydrolase